MTTLPVLLFTGVDGTRQARVGADEAEYRRAFCAFVESWGRDAVWFDEDSGLIGSDGGVTIGRWRARRLGTSPSLALVVLVADRPADVYLVDDVAMAERALGALARPGVEFELLPLEHLEAGDGARDAADPFLDLPSIRLLRAGQHRPPGPRPAFSDQICPRCLDHPLHDEPLFDPLLDGERACLACGTLAALRAAS